MPGIDRVTTYATFRATMGHISKVDAELANIQTQLSSGMKAQYYDGISDNARQFMQLEDRLSRSDQYLTNITLIRPQVQTTATVLGQLIESANTLKTMISQHRNAALSDRQSFIPRLTAMWKTMVGQLNTEIDGRYVLAGSRTDTKPVNSDQFPVLQDSSEPDDGYYLGDDKDLLVRVADGVELQYNIRANHSGIQKIFAGLALAKEADTGNSTDLLGEAYEFVQNGIKEVISAQALVNSNLVTLGGEERNINSLKVYWKGVKEEIGNADIIALSTQVSINQGILQSTFQAFAKISNLRLVDFLR